jgi:two-component system, cell cycle sensor histidine kinase and response regulator CckA
MALSSDALRVLIVGGDRGLREATARMLRNELGAAFEVLSATSLEQARGRISGEDVDAIVLDGRLSRASSVGFLKSLRDEGREIPVIRLETADGRPSAGGPGPFDSFVVSGLDGHVLSAAIRGAAAVRRSRRGEGNFGESEELYRVLFDANPLPAFLYDAATLDIIAVNDAAIARYGYSRAEFLSMNARDLRPEEDVPRFLEAVAKPHPAIWRAGSWRHRGKDGSVIDVDIQSHEITLGGRKLRLTLANDVTERHELEQQLRQAQRMEAVGRLAGGIAHDFNNLLTTILGYSELLLDRLESGDAIRGDVEEIRKAGDRAASLTRQLLAFSRKQVLQPKPFDLNAGVANLERMLGRLIGEDVELQTRLDPALGIVVADPGQIDQVIMNLAINARDAMPEGGRLTIETANAELGDDFVRQHMGARAGPYVMLGVSDTGVGMNEETRERIFEPFFTTKEPGKGTGLGLAMVYGIVKQSGGYIWVESEPGSGSSFRIYLPRTDRLDARPASGSRHSLLLGSESILLVEDEEAVRRFAQRVLEGAGYAVVAAPHAEAAIEIMRQRTSPVDLLLTDTVMPGMSGPRLAARLLEEFPGLKVVYMSGYTDAVIPSERDLESTGSFLQKPFTPATLLQYVREALEGSGHGLKGVQ